MARIYRREAKAATWFGYFENVADARNTQGEEAPDELLLETLQTFDSLVRGKHLWEFPILYRDPTNTQSNGGIVMNRN